MHFQCNCFPCKRQHSNVWWRQKSSLRICITYARDETVERLVASSSSPFLSTAFLSPCFFYYYYHFSFLRPGLTAPSRSRLPMNRALSWIPNFRSRRGYPSHGIRNISRVFYKTGLCVCITRVFLHNTFTASRYKGLVLLAKRASRTIWTLSSSDERMSYAMCLFS